MAKHIRPSGMLVTAPLVFNQYHKFHGNGPVDTHCKREFCSELVALPPHIQLQLLNYQSTQSLEILKSALLEYRNIHTGELMHARELTLIEHILASRSLRKAKIPAINPAEQEALMRKVNHILELSQH